MKYDMRAFEKSVAYYRKLLRKYKTILVVFDIRNTDAFYSMAPLSRAVHENGGDLAAMGINKKSDSLNVLQDAWSLYETYRAGKKTAATRALGDFIAATKIKDFDKIWQRPECILTAGTLRFEGTLEAAFQPKWHREYRTALLRKTAKIIFTQLYNLKKKERVSVGFELILKKKDMLKPLEDYLDSYAISRAMMLEAGRYGEVTMSASTPRMSMLEPMNALSDLRTTLLGCELSKTINEPIFRKFRTLSRFLKTARLSVADAAFFVTGRGYGGKHLFGDAIGYPDPDRRTRWQSPGMFIYKLDYYPQTALDRRKPQSRVGFTDTLPIDLFIKTCNIDWFAMKRRDDILRRIVDSSDKVVVRSNVKERYMTNFEVGLVKPDGTRRWPRGSDIDIREKINRDYLKKTGIVAGVMANIPGGEMFVTPEYLTGTVAGDVVVSIDQSYPLSCKEPLVISSTKAGYRVVTGPKKIRAKLAEKKREAYQKILLSEKNRAMPRSIIRMKKENFNRIGEFAINTNPKATLSGYLIVDEKIANMIHVALGSGFEPDRATEYHTDIVIDARRQKLDIYGVSGSRTRWILKKGRFCV
jgi:hypothetical protein